MTVSLVATSVPSERLFSISGNVITSERSCLTAEHADELIFLFENYDLMQQLTSCFCINYLISRVVNSCHDVQLHDMIHKKFRIVATLK